MKLGMYDLKIRTSGMICFLSIFLAGLVVGSPIASAADGSLFFFSTRYGANGSFVRLNMDNMSIEPLDIIGEHPTVSPSGRYLGYVRRVLHLYDLQAGSDLEVPTLRGGDPIMISDTKVAYISETRSGGFEIGVLSLDTMQKSILPHRLPERFAAHSILSLVPGTSGNNLSFVISNKEKLYLVTPRATREIFVSPTSGSIRYPAVSPDGRKVAFVRDSYKGLWVINIDGSTLMQINDSQDCGYPTWSPDGEYIAFYSVNSATRGILYQDVYNSSNTQRGAGGFSYSLWMMRADGSDVQQLQSDGKRISIWGRAIWK
jgi:dipeptidyl aminopeptidase/acylaminoacyl peptidase